MQAWASIQIGTWYARSSQFLQQPMLRHLRWMRVPHDILFSIGAALLAWFIVGLFTGALPNAPISPHGIGAFGCSRPPESVGDFPGSKS